MCIRKSGSSRRRAASALSTEHSSVRELHPWNPSQFCSPSGASNHCFHFTTRCRTSKMNLLNPWKIRLCPHANGYFNRFHLHRGKGRWRTRKGAERRKETRSPLPPCSPGDDTSGVLEDVDTYMLAYMHAYDANNNSPGPGFVIGSQTAGQLKRHDRDGNNPRSSRRLCGQEALGPDPLLRGHRKKRTPVRLQGCGSHPESQCRSPKGLVDG